MKAGWDINEIYAESPKCPASPGLIKPPRVSCTQGWFLGIPVPFPATSPALQLSHGIALGTGRGDRIPRGNWGKQQLSAAFFLCRELAGAERARARPEQAGICLCRLFIRQNLIKYPYGSGLPKSDLFFSSVLGCTVCSKRV